MVENNQKAHTMCIHNYCKTRVHEDGIVIPINGTPIIRKKVVFF